MAGRGLRHYSSESPHSRDEHLVNDGPLQDRSPISRSGPLLTLQPRLDLEAPPNLMNSHVLSPPRQSMEPRMAAQQAEIQRLITENQRLAVTHVALREELAEAQQEKMHLQQSRSANDTEKEQRISATQVALRQELADSKQEVSKLQQTMVAIRVERDELLQASMEKSARLEIELRGIENLKVDFDKIRFDREALLARVDHLTAELRKIPVKDQEIANLKREVDELRYRHQQARMDFELQKKLNFEHIEHQQVMEKQVFAKTREIERLRADLINTERRHQAYLAVSAGGPALEQSFQKTVPAAIYNNNYGPSQDALKGTTSENKSAVDISTYGAGVEASVSHFPNAAPVNADLAGEWRKHAAPNGRSFYYNAATGATQWENPSASAEAFDANTAHQRQTQQTHGTATPDVNSERTIPQNQPKKPTQQQQQVQQSVSPAQANAAALSQSGSLGVSLLVFGLSQEISDRDLASLFHPYGAILYAKVMVDMKSGIPQIYGLVTMENAQAAEAAVTAVNGISILGKRIKVEMQQGPPHQQPMMQHGAMQGGVGPIRVHHRPGGSAGHWPY